MGVTAITYEILICCDVASSAYSGEITCGRSDIAYGYAVDTACCRQHPTFAVVDPSLAVE